MSQTKAQLLDGKSATIQFTGGNASAPSVSFTGDTNTGIYSPGADQVAISTGGSGRLFVDASGNVGVGGSPDQKLTVVGNIKGVNGSGQGIQFINTTTPYIQALGTSNINDLQISAQTIQLQTGTTYSTSERLRITSAGLVGVGTSSPSYNLQVAETSAVVSAASYSTFFGQGTRADLVLRATSSNNDQQRQVIRSNSDSLIFGTENSAVTTFTEKLRIDSSGRVGIGNSSPGSYNASSDDFVVGDHVGAHGVTICSQNNSSGYIMFADGTTGAQTYAGQITYDHTNNRLTLGTNDGTTGLTVDSSQRVGIGTTSPGARLHVAGETVLGDDGSNGRFTVNTNTSRVALLASTTGFGAYQNLEIYGAATIFHRANLGEAARIDSSGRLLVGTSSARTNFFNLPSAFSPQLQVESAGTTTLASLSIVNNVASDSYGSALILSKSRGGSIGSNVILLNNDEVGSVLFQGNDGSEFVQVASVSAQIGGETGGNDMPGRLVFSTTADGASSPTERLRIDSRGYLTALGIYNNTTAAAANVHVSSAGGELFRSTSSIKYKTDVETIQDSYSEALLNCRPVWYRSTCEGDNANWGWWGFIAEEVAAIDPRLVHWKTTEVTYDEKGTAIQTPCDPEPESVQYDRFVPHLLNLIKRQQQAIETLEQRLNDAGIN